MTNKQGRPSSWTEEEVKDLIKMRENGVTVAEMARRLGRSEGAVSGKTSLLKAQGRIKDEEPTEPTKPASEEKGELGELEQEMKAIIEEQNATIERLAAQAAELKATNELHQESIDAFRQYNQELQGRIKDLERELGDTKGALAETEQQFDEYRRETENSGADAILVRYEQELERMEAEISRLTRALERANRIALGVVERFALEGVS